MAAQANTWEIRAAESSKFCFWSIANLLPSLTLTVLERGLPITGTELPGLSCDGCPWCSRNLDGRRRKTCCYAAPGSLVEDPPKFCKRYGSYTSSMVSQFSSHLMDLPLLGVQSYKGYSGTLKLLDDGEHHAAVSAV